MGPHQNNGSGVQFEGEQLQPIAKRPARVSFMVRMVMGMSGGMIKTEGGANVILIGIAVLCLTGTALLIVGSRDTSTLPPAPEEAPL